MTRKYHQPETKGISISTEHIICTSNLSLGGQSSPGGARAPKDVDHL